MTYAKVLFPALRLGYLILPPPLVEAFRAVRALVDTHPPILEQAVLTDFIIEGHSNRHLRRMRSLYAERRAALLEALAELPLDMYAAEAGLHCIGWLPEGMDDRALAAEAAVHGVDLVPISIFSVEPLPRKGFVFGYGEFNVARIQDGVRRLAAAIRSA